MLSEKVGGWKGKRWGRVNRKFGLAGLSWLGLAGAAGVGAAGAFGAG